MRKLLLSSVMGLALCGVAHAQYAPPPNAMCGAGMTCGQFGAIIAQQRQAEREYNARLNQRALAQFPPPLTKEPKLYCYEMVGDPRHVPPQREPRRVSFTREGNTVRMHNEMTNADYEFPVTREQAATLIFTDQGGKERMIYGSGREWHYTSLNGGNWDFVCYLEPTNNPQVCYDFNGGVVDCGNLEQRVARLRNVQPPSAYSRCVSDLHAHLSPTTMVYGGAARTMMDIERYCSQFK
jgi:hypothetical protein